MKVIIHFFKVVFNNFINVTVEQERSSLVKQQEDLLDHLRNKISELEESKVCAEMKSVELEEKLDTFIKEMNETKSLQSELQSAKSLLLDQQSSIVDLTQKLEIRREELMEQSSLQSPPSDKNIQDLESDLQEWKLKYETIELKLNSVLSKCDEWESRAVSLQDENLHLSQECEQLKIVIQKFENSITIHSESDESLMPNLKEELKKKEFELHSVLEENKIKNSELLSIQKKLESTETELQRLTSILDNVNETNRKLEELTAVIEVRDKQLEETTDKLNKVSKKLLEYKKFHKLKSEDVLKISQVLESVSASSQEKIVELEIQLSKAMEAEESLRKELEQMNLTGSQKKTDELTQKMKKLAASLKLKTKAIKDFEEKLTKMEKIIEEKEKIITDLESNKIELLSTLNIKQLELSEKENVITEQLKAINELNEIVIIKKTESEIPEHDNGAAYLDQIKLLEDENARLQEALNGNYILIGQINEDLLEARSMNNTLITQFDNMQRSYSDEEIKTKSILDQFDSEMLGNKKEIEDLVEQLSESTRKYEQAWAKLQEKDAYIENIEQELEKVKSKMLHIQTTLNERQERFEMTAEEIENRLLEAEIARENYQQHEDELEHKLSYLVSTEIILKSKLEKVNLDNKELHKLLMEDREINKNLLDELGEEKNKVKELRKELEELNERISKVNHTEDQINTLTSELKELRSKYENQIRQLEEREKINLYNFETEMQRLTKHIELIETERNELAENYEHFTTEKYNFKEEIQRLTEIINIENKLHVENLEQIKVDFEKAQSIEKEENLKEINRILEEHSIHVENLKTSFMCNEQSYCLNIQNLDSLNKELESELNLLRQQFSQIQLSLDSYQQEVLRLQELLTKAKDENDILKMDLVKEKAQAQIQDVVTTAEEKVKAMVKPKCDEVGGMNFFKWNDEDSDVGRGNLFSIAQTSVMENTEDSNSGEKVQNLENKLYILTSERERLQLRIKELESRINSPGEVKVGCSDPEDWAVNKGEEDGWGFTDAMLEAEHIQKQKANLDMFESQIADLHTKLKESEVERNRLSEELKVSQIKCGKLMKKAKEFKTKIDEMGKTKSVGFDDLDFAMQEELRGQIDSLEKTLKETKTEINTMKIEKDGFLKRIDTLTSGNERLVDMKERQDIEVEMWKKRSNDLTHQMQALEWRIEELMAEQNEPKGGEVMDDERRTFIQNALEMEEKLNSVAAENEYLLRVLGEARDQQKKQESPVHLNERIDELLNENENLNDQLEILKKESNNISEVNNEMQKLRNENASLNLMLNNLNTKLSTEYKQAFDESVEFSKRIEIIMDENKWLTLTVNNLNAEITDLKKIIEDFKLMENGINELKTEKELLNSVIRDLNDQLNEEKIKFENNFKDVSISNQVEISRLNAENVKLMNELEVLNTKFQNQSCFTDSLQNNSSKTILELESIKAETVQHQPAAFENEPILFRGFTDTSSVDLIDSTDNDREVQALKEQLSILNRLLENKEGELETMKQYVECSNVGKESLRDEFDDIVQQMQDENTATHSIDIRDVDSLRTNIITLNLLVKSKDNELNELKKALEQLKIEKENELELMRQYVDCSKVGRENLQDEFDDKVQQIQEVNIATHNIDVHDISSLRKKLVALNLLLQSKDNELDEIKASLEQMKIDKERMQEELMRKIEEIKIQQSNIFETTSFPGFSVVPEVPDIKYHRENQHLTEQVALLSRLLEKKDKEIEALKYQIKSFNSNTPSTSVDVQESFTASSEDPPAFRGFADTNTIADIFQVQKQTTNIQTSEHIPGTQNVFDQPPDNFDHLQNEIKRLKHNEQKKIKQYRSEIQCLQDENSLLNKLLQEKETELELMKQQVECLKVEKQNLQDEFADRILKIEAHKVTEHSELQGPQEDQQLPPSEVIAKLNEEILELKQHIQFRDTNIELLTQQNQQTIFEKDSMLQNLKKEVEEYKLKSESEANEVEKMKVEVENFKITIFNDLDSKYQTQLTSLHNELSTRDQKLMNSVNDLHNLKKDNELIEMKLKHTENKNEMYASENESLKEELNLVIQQHSTVQGVLQDNSNRIETDLMVTIRDLEERLMKAESDYNQALTELSEKQSIISDIEGKLEEYSLLQSEIRLSKQKIKELAEELSKIKSTREESINDLKLQLKTKEAEVENYKHEISEDKVTRSDLELPLTNTISNEALHYEEMIKLRDVEIAELTQTLNDMQERLFRKEEERLHNSGEDILRSRLDEALYTLHLRDVRCDELTLELMQVRKVLFIFITKCVRSIIIFRCSRHSIT